jgi:hypothetical protein
LKRTNNLNNNKKKRFSIVIVSAIILIVVIGTLPYYSVVLADGQFDLKQSNPFEPREQPPKILMVYNGKEYSGGLVGYSWEKTEVLDEIPEINGNITAALPDAQPAVKVKDNTSVKFKVKYINQTDASPDTLSVNVYSIDGVPIKVLDVSRTDKSTFIIDLDKGQYVLVSTATWLPENNQVISGYISYSYRIML